RARGPDRNSHEPPAPCTKLGGGHAGRRRVLAIDPELIRRSWNKPRGILIYTSSKRYDRTHTTITEQPENHRPPKIAELVDAMLAGQRETLSGPADRDLSQHAARELKVAQALRGGGPEPSPALLRAVERQVSAARPDTPPKPRRRLFPLQRPAFVAVAG